MTANPPARLFTLRELSRGMLAGYDETALRRQSHPELSPLLWHVGHVFFVENYWLAARVFDDYSVIDAWQSLYFPGLCAKTERSRRLPGPAELIAWTREIDAINDRYWQAARTHRHPLLEDGYLYSFMRQHYAQHIETMRMACAQLAGLGFGKTHRTPIGATMRASERRHIDAGEVTLGDASIDAYDNECPLVTRQFDAFDIAARCVTNDQWAAFMADGGYQTRALWEPAGWDWICAEGIDHPQHWQRMESPDGAWYDVGHAARPASDGDAPVHGISWYEARAYAQWADARLPSETEWEAAARAKTLTDIGEVWEWCADAFAPYPGFSPFPYDEYSMPWFDGAHFVARGASRFSEPDIRRPSFRNFYPPTHRHVFAGLRLAW